MQHELVSPTNGDRLDSSIASGLFLSPDRRSLSPPYLSNGGDLPYLYSVFSPEGTLPLVNRTLPASGSRSISISPSSGPFDEEEADFIATDNRLYLARLTLQYQEMAENYDLCLYRLRDAAEEVESLRRKNSSLRAANGELARRLGLLGSKRAGHVLTSAGVALADELRCLSVAEPPPPSPKESPTSVLAFQESGGVGGSHRLSRLSVPEKRVSLPKSISVRSSGYLKLKPAGSTPSRNGRIHVSNSFISGSQRVYVGGGSNNTKGETGGGGREDDEQGGEGEEAEGGGKGAVELEVYHQGMYKTELCNKWEESGECPYNDHCQFAHGIAELRPVLRHPRYKTELCRMVLSGGTCPYGHRCHFRHCLSPSDHQRLLRP